LPPAHKTTGRTDPRSVNVLDLRVAQAWRCASSTDRARLRKLRTPVGSRSGARLAALHRGGAGSHRIGGLHWTGGPTKSRTAPATSQFAAGARA